MKKEQLRKIFKERRNQLSSEEMESLSIKIAQNLVSYFKPENKRVSVFLPMSRFREVNTYPLIERLNSLNCTVCAPVSDIDKGTLKHIILDNQNEVVNNEWGIPEPTGNMELLPSQIDVVVVPLLTVDRFGNRIGYGKGFYDRFLTLCPSGTILIGIHYFNELTEEIEDVSSLDVPLDFIVTPEDVIKCLRK